MDYPCAKFGDFSSCFGFIMRRHKHTNTHTDRIRDADDRYTDAITIVMSNDVELFPVYSEAA